MPLRCNAHQRWLSSLDDGRCCYWLRQQGPLLPACSLCPVLIPPPLLASLCSATSSLTPVNNLSFSVTSPGYPPCLAISAPAELLLLWDHADGCKQVSEETAKARAECGPAGESSSAWAPVCRGSTDTAGASGGSGAASSFCGWHGRGHGQSAQTGHKRMQR